MAALVASGARAQDATSVDIVITATGLPQDRDETGQAITIIDAKTIDNRQSVSVADLLATTPSVRVNSNGSLGSVTSLSLRGAEAGQTVVLLDGVRINDPSGTSGAVDFGNLLIGNIRRIEVMRGANAIAYGSDAIGGVVNLSTREDVVEGIGLRSRLEGGFAGTLNGAADLSWAVGPLNGQLGLAALHTKGITSAASRFGATERDGLDNITAHGRIEAALSPDIKLDLRGYAVDADLAYDSFFGAPADSSDTSHFRQLTGYAGLNVTTGRLESRLSLTLLGNRRDYRFTPGTPPDFGYRGTRWRADYEGALTVGPAARLVLGLSHDAPDYRFFGFGSDETHKADTDSAFGMAILKPLAGLTLTGGLRYDHHSQFGGVTTFGANANWGLDAQTRIRLAYGEGFRAPSLYQLYDTYSGNRALLPERSHSFDLGLDRSFGGGKGHVALTLFARTTRNQIDYDLTTFAYANLARTIARGIELSVDYEPVKDSTIALAYSLIDTRDRTPASSAAYGQHLPRRPLNSLSLSLDRRWPIGLSTGATVRLVESSRDPTAPTGRLDGYALLDLRAAMPLGGGFELYARLDNALDERYETSYGYSSYGRAAYAGVRMSL